MSDIVEGSFRILVTSYHSKIQIRAVKEEVGNKFGPAQIMSI